MGMTAVVSKKNGALTSASVLKLVLTVLLSHASAPLYLVGRLCALWLWGLRSSVHTAQFGLRVLLDFVAWLGAPAFDRRTSHISRVLRAYGLPVVKRVHVALGECVEGTRKRFARTAPAVAAAAARCVSGGAAQRSPDGVFRPPHICSLPRHPLARAAKHPLWHST